MSLNSRDTSAGKTNEEHTYKQTEVGLIPVDWDVCDLQDAVDFLDGMRRPVKSGDRAKISGVFPYYGASGIVDYVNDYIFDDELILLGEDGENILSRNLPLAFKVSGKIWVNNHAHVLKPKSSFDITFLTEFLESLDYSLLNSGTAQPKLNKKSCLKIKIAKPALEEQTAIANALSDVDALIQELEKLIAKKQAIKTATMQQLLTGRTRLPQFANHPDGRKKGYKPSELGEIPEDWEVKTVYELAGFQKNLFDDGDWVEAEHITDKGVRLIQTGNIGVGQFVEKNAKKYIFETSYEKLKCKQLQAGDLLICRLAEPAGRACILPDIGELKVITSVDVTIFRPNCELVSREFYNQYFASTDWFNLVLEQVGGTTHKRISRGALGRIAICNPSFEEQNEIATILGDMDKEIQSLEKRLFKTRQIKQGMMQELLTGKTRLVQPLNKESQHG